MTDDKVKEAVEAVRLWAEAGFAPGALALDDYILRDHIAAVLSRHDALQAERDKLSAENVRIASLAGSYKNGMDAAEAKLTALVEASEEVSGLVHEERSGALHVAKGNGPAFSAAIRRLRQALAHHSAQRQRDVTPSTDAVMKGSPSLSATPTGAPVEDVGGLPCSPLQRARAVATMLMANLRLARGETGVKGWRSDYVVREYAALMGLNLDGPANLTATDLAVYAYPEQGDESKRRAFESGFLAALSPSLIQPAPVCVMCGAVNADPRPWDPREPVCPDCQDRRGPRPIQPQGEERS